MIPNKKYCKGCNVTKPKKYFRIRTDNRYDPPRTHLNYLCNDCEKEKKKQRTENMLLADRKYRENNRDEINRRGRERSKTEHYRKVKKEYRQNNKEKILARQRLNKKKYIDNVTDAYAKKLLRQQGKPAEFIEIKKTKIALHRLKKIIKNKKYENLTRTSI